MYPKSANHRSYTHFGGSIFHRSLVALSVSALLVAHTTALGGLDTETTGPPSVQDFDWETITPSAQLEWQKCYPSFECARFYVPFDYSDPDGEKFAIAMVRYPSKLSPNDAEYRGPILINPGGPGGSGVEFVLQLGATFQQLIGEEFDYIGFDPRGVGRTTPRAEIFPSPTDALALLGEGRASMNTSTEALGIIFGQMQIISALAQSLPRNYFEHLSTPEVATDMLNIVKAHGMDKLQYWGLSYGTVLGATYAAMYPDNVGTLINDGVVDSENYYATLWDNMLFDSDLTLSVYYQDCINAGPELCPIYEPTIEQIRERVNNVLEQLKIEPRAFANATDRSQGLVGYDIVKSQLLEMVYAPHIVGKAFAERFAALEAGNPWPFWSASPNAVGQKLLRDSCSTNVTGDALLLTSVIPIACSDGAPINDTLADLQDYYSRLSEQSSFADVWYMRIGCAPWRIPAKNRFQGNFVANTSHPLLFIGNTADPVTPLRNARKMATGFSGAVVLQQDGPGHCSTASSSVCTSIAIRNYFRNGTLPEPDTICPVETSSFLSPVGRRAIEERSYIHKAVRDIHEHAHRLVMRRF